MFSTGCDTGLTCLKGLVKIDQRSHASDDVAVRIAPHDKFHGHSLHHNNRVWMEVLSLKGGT